MPKGRLNYSLIVMFGLIVVLPGCASKGGPVLSAGCPDIAKTGQLNVLSLNTLFDAPAAIREKSWTDIAQFAVANNVHVLLLQEAVLTDVDRIQKLLGTSDSARDLQRVLNQRSAEPYDLRFAWETGVPLVLTTANAILSRCTFTRHFSTFLPIESEVVFEGVQLKITRNVQVGHIDIPGYGSLHVYNTHLCSACSVDALRQQVEALLAFTQSAEGKVRGKHVMLGGDFNLDISKGVAEQAIYETITRAGFRDVYAEYRKTKFGDALESLCGNGVPDAHCTDGVSSIQGLIDQQTGAGFSTPARIDYLFLHSADTVSLSKVVFDPGNAATGPINSAEPAVSDHSAIFSQIMLTH
ncbi:endonuclease/exonuclease/phosphatase family protein [Nitrospira sp. Nam74]